MHTGNLAHRCSTARRPSCSISTVRPKWVSVAQRPPSWARSRRSTGRCGHDPAAPVEVIAGSGGLSPTSLCATWTVPARLVGEDVERSAHAAVSDPALAEVATSAPRSSC
jgi:hypothetical protein